MKIGDLVRYTQRHRNDDHHECLGAFFIVVAVDQIEDGWVRIQSTKEINFRLPERTSCLEVVCEGR